MSKDPKILQIKPYDPLVHEELWDTFIVQSINGTIFHERKFIKYHIEKSFLDGSVLIFEDEDLLAVFPAAILEKDGERILKSHPGTSYGGLIFCRNPGIKLAMACVQALESHAKSLGIDRIEFRHCEKFFLSNQIDELDFVLLHSGFVREAEELSTFYDLEKIRNISDRRMIDRLSLRTQDNYFQARKKGVTTRFLEREEISSFYHILEENLRRHEAHPVHSFEELLRLMDFYPERVKIFGSFRDSTLLSAFLLLHVGKNGWHIFYSALDYQYEALRPVNFAVVELLKFLKATDCRYLNYGISTEKGGTVINYGLFEFKESFGGEGALRTYWSKKI